MFRQRRERKAEEQAALAKAARQQELAQLDELLEEARSFRGTDASDTPRSSVVLKRDERCFLIFENAVLIEPRVSGGHWEGRSQGVSIPVAAGVRYRIGASRGHYVKEPEQPTIIDTGTAVVTDRRVLFAGPKQTREWLWSKCVAIAHDEKASWTVISVSNRQKASGIGYDDQHATVVRFRIDLAEAVASGTEAQLVAELEQARAAVAGPVASPTTEA